MTKYDEQFRQQLVDEYLAGDIGLEGLATRHGVDYSMLRGWIARYENHGSAGLRKKFTRYDARFKLEVLQRMWRDDLSCRQVTALFDIRDPASVARWARLYDEGGIDALTSRSRRRLRKMTAPQPEKPTEETAPDARTREDLLKEIEYLRAEVAYLKKFDALLEAKKRAALKKKHR
ncbi:transposase [Paraburkholderia sp. GAS42]